MRHWTTNTFQYALFIIFTTILSVVTGDHVTTITTDDSRNFGGRIVNGTKVVPGEFKFIVSLRATQAMNCICSGSLIKDNWVITAAHCVSSSLQPASKVTAVVGDVKLNPSGPMRQTSIGRKWIKHPEYAPKLWHSDIGLLMLENPFITTEYVQPIGLSLTLPPPGTMCAAAGWGFIKENNSKLNNDLLFTEVPIISHSQCRKYFGDVFYAEGKICAGYEKGGSDFCSGDSGGPLECNGLLTGIISAGVGCARPKRPGMYTDVSFYTDWINGHIEPPVTVTMNNVETYNTTPVINCSSMPLVFPFHFFLSLLFISVAKHMFPI